MPVVSTEGWLGLGNLRANGHPSGGPWRQFHCTSCQQFPLTPCKFYATMVADSSDSVSTIRFRLVKRFLRLEITGRLLESELML